MEMRDPMLTAGAMHMGDAMQMGRTMAGSEDQATVVLVHAAWADGSSWSKVIVALQARGLRVIAAPIPLTSLRDDIAALEGVLARTRGPVVLAAHAYAGAVISGTLEARVKALCFITALTPDAGETVLQVFTRERPHPQAPELVPDSRGFIWLPDESFKLAFAQNASPEQAALLAATQRPISVQCIQERAAHAAWRNKRSWYLIAEEDRMIHPRTQRFLAERMGAQIRAERVDHVPIVTAPEAVVEMILEAVASMPLSAMKGTE
jgi:pimeloyl-ACP methyl ester carboxylesterase